MNEKVKGKREVVLLPAIKSAGINFLAARVSLEQRLTALNRLACLHKGEPCAATARAEFIGMLTVINAIGYEADGDWDRYDNDIYLNPAKDFASNQEGGDK